MKVTFACGKIVDDFNVNELLLIPLFNDIPNFIENKELNLGDLNCDLTYKNIVNCIYEIKTDQVTHKALDFLQISKKFSINDIDRLLNMDIKDLIEIKDWDFLKIKTKNMDIKDFYDDIKNIPIDIFTDIIKNNLKNNDIYHYKDTILIYFVANNFEVAFKLFIENDININVQNSSGFTALHCASMFNHINCLKLLIDAGADVNIIDKDYKSPLAIASLYDNIECGKLLIDAGAYIDNPNSNFYNSPLKYASKNGNKKYIKLLLEAGASTDNYDALFDAYKNRHIECVELLIKAGANIDFQNENERTSLILASSNGHYRCIELLIKAGADINIKDRFGYSALIWASRNGYFKSLEVFVNAGANLNIQSNNENTPLVFASKKGYYKCVKLLIKAGADISIKNKCGYTALSHTLITSYRENNKDNEFTWFSQSDLPNLENKHKKCIKLLVKANADLN
jgi:ankyrin repeat protein